MKTDVVITCDGDGDVTLVEYSGETIWKRHKVPTCAHLRKALEGERAVRVEVRRRVIEAMLQDGIYSQQELNEMFNSAIPLLAEFPESG